MGHEVQYLRDYELNPESYAYAMEVFKPDLVFASGHGGPNVFTTMNVSPLIVACTNDGLLAGSSIFFISCLTGIELVPSIIKKGGKVAAGFTSEFTWIVSDPYDPATDPCWKPFERMLIESSMEILRGNSWSQWYNTLQRVGKEEEAKWGRSTDPQAPDIIYALRHDYQAATYMGEGISGGVEGFNPLLLIPIAALLLK
jgi:hypothetical protein